MPPAAAPPAAPLHWSVRLKRLGPWISILGILAGAALAGLAATPAWLEAAKPPPPLPPSPPSLGSAPPPMPGLPDTSLHITWENAAGCFTLWAVFILVIGLMVSCFPELVHVGAVAGRFARAERRHLGARHGILRLAAWGGLFIAGAAALALASAVYDRRLGGEILIVMIVAGFGVSILLPAVTASAGAVAMSASRRDGGAHDLLMGPHSAGHLAWAAARSRALRGTFWLLAFLPCYAAAAWLFAEEFSRHEDLELFTLFAAVLGLLVVIDTLFLAACAALGVWLGAAVPVPALAGVLAGPASVGLWLVRLLAIAICAGISDEMWHDRTLEFWSWLWLGTLIAGGAALCLAAAFVRLARASLMLPLALRFGAWMVRYGENLVGLGGERPAKREREEDWAAEPPELPRSGMLWKLAALAAWPLAAACLVLFPLAGGLADAYALDWRSLATPAFWAGYLFIAALCLVFWLVARHVAGRIQARHHPRPPRARLDFPPSGG